MFWGCSEHWYRKVPGVAKVIVTDSPGPSGRAVSGLGSKSWTVCEKLSLFVQVTVVPAFTVIAVLRPAPEAAS